MGNVEMHDFAPVHEDERKELDMSIHVDYRNYCKHINGEDLSESLKELPWAIRDSISLYERINVSFNSLTTLPPELPFRLPHLSFIDLSYNQVSSLPESIGLLFHLKEFLVTHNSLTKIPSTFVHLVKLKKFDVSHNKLEELPQDMGEMESLTKLNVSNNKLKFLPESFGLSKTLQVLLAVCNSCETFPPQAICDKGSEATLIFLRKFSLSKNISAQENNANVFSRVRGNVVQTSVPNPHSARAQYVQIQTETMNTASRIRTPLLPPIDATKFHPDELKDRLIGLIYGAVIGDALGIATEFLTPDECRFHYNKENLRYDNIIRDEHRVHWKKGEWTSNFDQMLLVLESLLQWAGVVDELEFAKRLITWKKSGYCDLQSRENYIFSNTINLVLQDKNFIRNPHRVAQQIHQKGHSTMANGSVKAELYDPVGFVDSGALPRALILGIPRFHDLADVISNSIRICLATHYDERCKATCVALTVAVAVMLQGKHALDDLSSVNDLLKIAEEYGSNCISDSQIKEEFRKVCLSKDFESIHITEMGRMCHTFKAFAAAFVSLRQQQDYRKTLSLLLMQGGYSSMNGCIAGALLGCKFGFSQLPKLWIEGLDLKHRECLNTKINALLDMMGLP